MAKLKVDHLEQELKGIEARLEARWGEQSRHMVMQMSSLTHEAAQMRSDFLAFLPVARWYLAGMPPPPPVVTPQMHAALERMDPDVKG